MPDIREILKALDPEDRAIWSQHRTEMRRSYLNAHNTTVGIKQWDAADDMFMDLMDIKLALLFDRAGRFEAVKEVATQEEAAEIEDTLHKANDNLKVSKLEGSLEGKTISYATQPADALAPVRWAN